jgi:hypothetical protein
MTPNFLALHFLIFIGILKKSITCTIGFNPSRERCHDTFSDCPAEAGKRRGFILYKNCLPDELGPVRVHETHTW